MFEEKNSQKRARFCQGFRLQEAVFYLGRPRRAQQSVSLTGLLQPVLLWKSVSRVLRHGVGLLFKSQRAEGRKIKHNFTLCTQSYMSHRRTHHSQYLLMSLCGAGPVLPYFFFFHPSSQQPQVIFNSKMKRLTHFENI